MANALPAAGQEGREAFVRAARPSSLPVFALASMSQQRDEWIDIGEVYLPIGVAVGI